MIMMTQEPTDPDTGRIAKRVLDRIDAEHLRPRPRWTCLFRNYFFWALGAAAVSIGAFASSAMIFEVQNADWQYAFITHKDGLSFFIDAAPFIWIAILAVFIGIGYLNVRRTNHGYRYPLPVIAIGAVLASIALGSVLYEWGFGSIIEEAAGTSLPFYRSITEEQHAWWLEPGKGLLAGTVMKSAPDVSSFDLKDFEGKVWHVEASDLSAHAISTVAHGGTVRVIGLPAPDGSAFHACFVLPWETYGERRAGPVPAPVAVIGSTTDRVPSDACARIPSFDKLRTVDEDDAF